MAAFRRAASRRAGAAAHRRSDGAPASRRPARLLPQRAARRIECQGEARARLEACALVVASGVPGAVFESLGAGCGAAPETADMSTQGRPKAAGSASAPASASESASALIDARIAEL